MLKIATPPTALDQGQRDVLGAVAGVILPAYRGMPGAAEIDAIGKSLDRVLAAGVDPDNRLGSILTKFDGRDVEAALQDLMVTDRKALDFLIFICSAAYYLNPEVRDLIRYHGQQAEVIDRNELPEYLEDGTLERVGAPGNLSRELKRLEELT